MPAAHRHKDICTGHGCWDSRPNASASHNVFVNNKGAHRVGDFWEVHCCGPACHGGTQATGSPNVFVNNKPIARIGDDVDCGSKNETGSPNVFVNEAKDIYVDPWGGGYVEPIKEYPKQIVSTELIGGLYRDKPETYYNKNVKPRLKVEDVPDATYPVNSEQVEEKPAQEYVESKVPGCGELEWVNPFIEAKRLVDLGASAWKENGSNPNITALWDTIGYEGSKFADETAWCAVFVSAVLKRSGNKYIKTASSQAYNSYGKSIPSLAEAKTGDIVVFFRKGEGSGYGHVGFYAGTKTSSTVAILGGNQGDSVNIRNFKISDPNKGWGVKTIRRAVSCKDGTEVPDVNYSAGGNIETGGSVT